MIDSLVSKVFVVSLIILIVVIVVIATNPSDSVDKYGDINTPAENPLKKMDDLITILLDNRAVTSQHKLSHILKRVIPGERLGIFSIYNDKEDRTGLEYIGMVKRYLVPYIDKILSKRGLMVAKNVNDGVPILQPYITEGYDYILGYWLFIEKVGYIA